MRFLLLSALLLVACDETTERLVLRAPETLAFPTHTQVVREWCERRR